MQYLYTEQKIKAIYLSSAFFVYKTTFAKEYQTFFSRQIYITGCLIMSKFSRKKIIKLPEGEKVQLCSLKLSFHIKNAIFSSTFPLCWKNSAIVLIFLSFRPSVSFPFSGQRYKCVSFAKMFPTVSATESISYFSYYNTSANSATLHKGTIFHIVYY